VAHKDRLNSSNSGNARLGPIMRMAVGSPLQGIFIITCVVLLAVGLFYFASFLLSSQTLGNSLHESSELHLQHAVVSFFGFAKPVVLAWALVAIVSAAIRQRSRTRSKPSSAQNESNE
jgi:hypothetical protein